MSTSTSCFSSFEVTRIKKIFLSVLKHSGNVKTKHSFLPLADNFLWKQMAARVQKTKG